MYLLGIDIGTSACKLALFEENGAVAGCESACYPVYYPHEGWAEQEPDAWWAAIGKASRRLLEKSGAAPAEIAGIGIDGQSWSAIAVDGDGNVLTRNPIWMDQRAAQICRQTERRIGAEAIFGLCGNALQAPYTTGKILWYRENLPDVFAKTEKILQSNSFIAYRLTGALTQDVSQGYGLHCFDMRKKAWDDAMCRELGIPRKFLPELTACHAVVGRVTREAAAFTGLAEGTPVTAGGLDAACGTLGVGVLEDGQTQEQGGQAGGMSICSSGCTADPRLILGAHVVPERWLLQGGTVGGGGVMKWFEQEFGAAERELAAGQGQNSFEILSDEAAAVPAGSGGVVFLPYMAGERSPIWDGNAKGVFYGLDYAKTRPHMVRACMEGVAYALRHNLETAEQTGAAPSVLRAMGGSANSLVWTQLKADITQRVIEVPASDTASTLGAALLAGVGTGVYRDFSEAVSKTVRVKRIHQPNPALKGVYDDGYDTYRRIYDALRPLMQEKGRQS